MKLSLLGYLFAGLFVSGLWADVTLQECPSKIPDGKVALQSGKGANADPLTCILMDEKAAKQSVTIKNLIEDSGTGELIPVPNIADDGLLLSVASIMDKLKDFKEEDKAGRAQIAAEQLNTMIQPKGKLTELNYVLLKRLILTANHLDIRAMLDAGAKMYGDFLFAEDLAQIAKFPDSYGAYKKSYLTELPKDIQGLMLERYLLRQIATLKHDAQVNSVAFGRNGRMLTGSNDETAKLWSEDVTGDDSQPLATLKHANLVTSVAFGLNGRMLTGSVDRKAKLWSADVTGDDSQPLATLKHVDSVTSVAFGSDGRLLTGSKDGTAKVWAANVTGDNAQPLATLKHGSWVRAVAFGPDRLLTGSVDETAKVWAANVTGDDAQPLATLKHGGWVRAVAFGPGGRLLTGSGDGTAKLWAANVTGDNAQPLATLKHKTPVFAVAFGPDGRLLTGSEDGTAKLWMILDPSSLDQPLVEAQIIAFVQKNEIAQSKMPEHLLKELSDHAKRYLGW